MRRAACCFLTTSALGSKLPGRGALFRVPSRDQAMSVQSELPADSQRGALLSAGRRILLFLSGYLLGMTAAHAWIPVNPASALAGSTFGLAAYAALETASRRNQAADARRQVDASIARLELRMERHARHISIHMQSRLRKDRKRPHQQYLTVVRSAGGVS